MKINKKGFTLIELLAVVVILLAISVMAISSISAAIERNKEKQNDTKTAVIESYAELYYNDHKNTLSQNGCIAVSKLIEENVLTEKESTDANGEPIGGYIKYTNGKNFTYQENNTGC